MFSLETLISKNADLELISEKLFSKISATYNTISTDAAVYPFGLMWNYNFKETIIHFISFWLNITDQYSSLLTHTLHSQFTKECVRKAK